MKSSLEDIKNRISECLYVEKAYDIPTVCSGYGLETGKEDEAYSSKKGYVSTRVKDKDEQFIINLAKKVATDYNCHELGFAINKYTDDQYYLLTELTRRKIVEQLKKEKNITGKQNFKSFCEALNFLRFLPHNMPEHKEDKIKILFEYLLKDDLIDKLLDSQVFVFLEQLVHPKTREGEEVKKYLNFINEIISVDGLELVEEAYLSDKPLHKVRKKSGVNGKIKNIIFASTSYKPEIVINDALNNDIMIVKNEESCLVYDRQINNEGLRWKHLIDWWADLKKSDKGIESGKKMIKRLHDSVGSDCERKLFEFYYKKYKRKLEDDCPILIPQVYLHYDPYTMKKHGVKYLTRQRMDFLILFSNSQRVVIEVDGKQHYSIADKASPELYSDMIKLDRELKFLNYDVYRLGGYELTYNFEETATTFFESLFDKYN